MQVPSQMYIDGKWVAAENSETMAVLNPASQEVLATVPKGTREDARRAIDSAVEAKVRAESMTAYERSKVLLKVAHLLEQNAQEMATLITKNVGKPITDSEAETARGVVTLTFAAEEAKRIYGQTYPLDAYQFPPGNQNRLGFTIREPIGVVGAISPFNFPLNLLLHKVAPALAAGNTVVVKPPSDGPLPALMLAKLCEEAGLPRGILNVVLGPGGEVGDELITSTKIDAISFTGDTETGRSIAEKGARTNKKMILELGGHNPLIVLDDAKVVNAVSSALMGTFSYAGQVCTATRRIILSERIKERFLTQFEQAVGTLKVGNPMDRTTSVGPVINVRSLQKIDDLVKDASGKGAKVMLGGSRMSYGELAQGNYYAPTILDGVVGGMNIAQTEVFGPVSAIMEASSDDEAVEMANNTIYGLQASIYTSDLARGIRLAKRIKAGGVMINDRTNLRWDNAPFGGIKRSGMGREGVSLAIGELTEVKFIVANIAE
jgi:acyl-CoA reductase-like NAD-dependent aldehyde dehydrogenase